MNNIQILVINPMIYSGLAYWGMSGFWLILDIFICILRAFLNVCGGM